jgi:hypothetical protein
VFVGGWAAGAGMGAIHGRDRRAFKSDGE